MNEETAVIRRKVLGRLMDEIDRLYQAGARTDELEILVNPKVLKQVTGYEYVGELPATISLMGMDCIVDVRAGGSFGITRKTERALYLQLDSTVSS